MANTTEIKSFGVWPMAKISAILMANIGFILGIIYAAVMGWHFHNFERR